MNKKRQIVVEVSVFRCDVVWRLQKLWWNPKVSLPWPEHMCRIAGVCLHHLSKVRNVKYLRTSNYWECAIKKLQSVSLSGWGHDKHCSLCSKGITDLMTPQFKSNKTPDVGHFDLSYKITQSGNWAERLSPRLGPCADDRDEFPSAAGLIDWMCSHY